jgi:hypothetical protein
LRISGETRAATSSKQAWSRVSWRSSSAAFAVDWPGWSRGAKTADQALDPLAAYRERYRPVAARAGLGRAFNDAGQLEVVEDRVGTGATDFWGISFSPSSLEQEPMDAHGLFRLRASFEHYPDRHDGPPRST